jgi:hypothetical protein
LFPEEIKLKGKQKKEGEGNMSMWKSIIAVSALLTVLNGCEVILDPCPYVEVEYEVE